MSISVSYTFRTVRRYSQTYDDRLICEDEFYFAAVIVLSFASIAVATFVGLQKAKAKTKSRLKRLLHGQTAKHDRRGNRNSACCGNAPLDQPTRTARRKPALTMRSTPTKSSSATQCLVARPYAVALERVSSCSASTRKMRGCRLHAARLAERLGQYDKAATEMTAVCRLETPLA